MNQLLAGSKTVAEGSGAAACQVVRARRRPVARVLRVVLVVVAVWVLSGAPTAAAADIPVDCSPYGFQLAANRSASLTFEIASIPKNVSVQVSGSTNSGNTATVYNPNGALVAGTDSFTTNYATDDLSLSLSLPRFA